MDVVLDTDILSTFAKINKPRLLSRLFHKSHLLVCPSVSTEIHKAVDSGLLRFPHTPRLIEIKLNAREKISAIELRETWNLGFGDAECLAVARNRNGLLLTNDRKVQKVGDSLSINSLNLSLLLRELWVNRVMPKRAVGRLADEIERKDRVIIKNRGLIFK